MFSLIFLLMMFVAGATAAVLIAYSVVKSRSVIVFAVGAVVLFGFIVTGLFAWILVPHMQSSPVRITGANTTTHIVSPSIPELHFSADVPTWFMGIKGIAIVAVIFVLVVRRSVSPHAGHGLRRAWPALVVLGIVGFIFFVRISSSYEHAQISTRSAIEAADAMAARQEALLKQQQSQMVAQLQQHEQRKQQAIAHGDIHELIEKFEEPRITIPPQVEAPKVHAPTAVTPVSVPPNTVATSSDKPTDKASASASEPGKGDAPKTGTVANQKHKKTKATNANDAKSSAQAAQAKPAQQSTEKNDSKSSSKAAALLAEAETDKPKARPAWVDESPKRTGATRREVISTDQYESIDECYQAADVCLLLKTYNRMQQLAGQTPADGPLPSITFDHEATYADGKLIIYGNAYAADEHRLSSLRQMGITADYLRREIVAKDPKNNDPCEYIETVQRTFGPMKKLYLQLEFTPAIDRQLMQYWDARLRTQRFATVGGGAGALLSLLGLVFALLKIDTWTKGYYTKRLFIGVPAAIIAGVLLLAMLGTHSYR